MLSFFYLIITAFAEIRFCALPNDIQSIKTRTQIEKHELIIADCFHYVVRDALAEVDGMDTFLLLDGKEMAGFVKFQKTKVYSLTHRKSYDMLACYCFAVADKYKGRGLSYRLLEDAIAYLKKRYSLSEDTVLSLHLSPLDENMPIAAKIYYSYGFTHGMFIEYDPKELAYNIDKMFDQTRDMGDVISGKETANGTGYYFLLYCFLKDFGKNKSNNKIEVKDTRILFDRLKYRYAEYKKQPTDNR